MGYAIQRGATCTVAAVDEVVTERTCRRLLSLLEAALWVAGGLLVAQALQLLPTMPAGYAVSAWTVIGGVLLGLGAFVNGACVFGAIARFGSGEWAYIVTPIGFFVGCLSVAPLFGMPMPRALPYGSPVLAALGSGRSAVPRVSRSGASRGRGGATPDDGRSAGIGPSQSASGRRMPRRPSSASPSSLMLLLVGGWAYTDVLAELARGMSASVARAQPARCWRLLAGAALGGWTAGRLPEHPRIGRRSCVRCLAGGMLMGWGSLLLPGGNDGLILVGMPLAWPYAWLAFADHVRDDRRRSARATSPDSDRLTGRLNSRPAPAPPHRASRRRAPDTR